MNTVYSLLLLVGLVAVFASDVQAQAPTPRTQQPVAVDGAVEAWREMGVARIYNYTPADYGEHSQNWAVVHDGRGVIYAGNGHGLLEYDGVSWRFIPTGSTMVRSLARDSAGVIYVGAYGDFGYLAPDSLGVTHFVSLRERLAVDDPALADVWRTHSTREGVYFQTFSTLFRWSGDRLRTWSPDSSSFFLSAVVRDTLYVENRQRGLMRVVGDSLAVIPASRALAPMRVFTMLPYDARRILVASGTHGLLLFDGHTFTPFETDANAFLRRHQLSSGAVLANGHFALGTYRGGVVIIDQEGTVRQVVNEAAGLQINDVKYVYADPRGALWLALDFGIAQVQTPSPLSFFTEAQGLEGSVLALARHRQTLYAGTSQGVYALDVRASGTVPRFNPVRGLADQAFDLLDLGETLLAATNEGVYRIQGAVAVPIPALREAAFVLYRSRRDTNTVYVGLKEGVAVLQLRGGQWRYSGRIGDLQQEVRSIVEEETGALWLGTMFQGVLRASVSPGSRSGWDAEVERFGVPHGLPGGQINVSGIDGRVMFATEEGLRRFDAGRGAFVADSTLGAVFADTTRWVLSAVEDRFKQVAIWSGKDNLGEVWLAHPQRDGTYEAEKDRYQRIAHFGSVKSTFTDEDGVMWFGGATGLVRYDPAAARQEGGAFSAMIRRVATIPEDRLLFGGSASKGFALPHLPFKTNSLHFEFAAPAFEDVTANRYQYRLEGFDEGWSAWTRETRKDYTNLPEGAHRFLVRARDPSGALSSEAGFAFSIAPPWYRTWWAYVFYLGAGGLLVFGTVRWRSAKLEAENRRLEHLVTGRTAELQQALHTLTQTQDQLIHAEKMASLGQMTAGIAHEIKNPLNFINNFSEMVGEMVDELGEALDTHQRDMPDGVSHHFKEILADLRMNSTQIEKHGKRADGIVRAMMQHASGGKGSRESTDVNALVSEYIDLAYHGKQAQTPGFTCRIERALGEEVATVEMVPQEIGRVLMNLLSNAFDAVRERMDAGTGGHGDTETGYAPTVTVSTHRNGKTVEIRIADNGPGIPEDYREKIFEPFFTTKPTGSGTGLGLSLSYDIVTQGHGGTLTVESMEDEGATFVITLPTDSSSLSHQQ